MKFRKECFNMEKKSIDEFREKIMEAIRKLQITLPNQLTEEEMVSIDAIINVFVTDIIESRCGLISDLHDLICMPISDYEYDCKDKNKDKSEEYNRYIKTIEAIIKNGPPLLSIQNEQEIAEKVPYLPIFIDNENDIQMFNHVSQLVYSTDKNDKVIKDYFVKSHAQTIRDIRKEKSNGLEDKTN